MDEFPFSCVILLFLRLHNKFMNVLSTILFTIIYDRTIIWWITFFTQVCKKFEFRSQRCYSITHPSRFLCFSLFCCCMPIVFIARGGWQLFLPTSSRIFEWLSVCYDYYNFIFFWFSSLVSFTDFLSAPTWKRRKGNINSFLMYTLLY